MGPLPHRSVHELSKKYGPIMHLKFGSKNVVIGSSVEMAKDFLKTMDINFVCRPKNAAGKYTTYNYSDITWAPYGPYWRQSRKMCVVELFRNGYHTKGRKTKPKLSTEWKSVKRRSQIEAKKSTPTKSSQLREAESEKK
ncbi:cytochrome P450 71A1-like protein [Tanacetum coccineum]